MQGHTVPDVELTRADSTTFHLSDLAGKPLILNPIFTRCPAACPAITSSLRDALKGIGAPGVGYNVLTISFDPADGPAAMRRYKEHLKLPDGWILATATPANLKTLLDAIDYHVAPVDGGGFAHPNVVIVLSPTLIISGYVNGIEYEPSEIRAALEQAARTGSLLERVRPYLLVITVLMILIALFVIGSTRKRPGGA